MITKTHDIVLQLTEPDYIKSGIKLVANDYLTNIFNIRIYEGAAEINYSQVHHATIVFAKPDNTYVQGSLTKVSTGFTFTVGTNAIAAAGGVVASVQLFGSNNERLSTSRFQFTVIRDLADQNAVESSSEFPPLENFISMVEEKQQQIDDVISKYNDMLKTSHIILKSPVATYADIATTYPVPENAWTTRVIETGELFRYNSDTSQWEWIDTITTSAYDLLLGKVEQIEQTMYSGAQQSLNLLWGMNLIRIPEMPTAPKFKFSGFSITNLLGRDGNCEDITKAAPWQCVNTIDSTNKVFGTYGIKGTITTTGGYAFARSKQELGLDNTKYYMVSAYVKNGNATNIGIGMENASLVTITDTTKFNRICVKYSPAIISARAATDKVIVYITGVSNQYAYVDGFMINEISAADYALSDTELMAKYPYVDSYACLTNAYFENRRYNLVRNGNSEQGIGYWKPTAISTATLSIVNGKLRITNTSSSTGVYQLVPVKKNTDYYISANLTNGTATAAISIFDSNVTNSIRSFYPGTFNSGNNDVIAIYLHLGGTGYADFDSIMLIEGTTAPTEYKSQDLQRFVIEGQFTSDDTVTLENGKVSGLLWWKHKFLSNFDWAFVGVNTGYKYIALPNLIQPLPISDGMSTWIVTKHDGKILKNGAMAAGSDVFYYDSNKTAYLSISNSDAGWTDSINPNNDEVNVYIKNGWKAVANNGTRYIMWRSVVDNSYPVSAIKTNVATGATSSNQSVTAGTGTTFKVGDTICHFNTAGTYLRSFTVTSVSADSIGCSLTFASATGDLFVKADNGTTDTTLLTWCKSNIAPNYEGYQLHYRLANPEPITDVNVHVEGEILDLVKGDNYVTVDSGIVLDEVVTPVTNGSSYAINDTTAGKELSLFKNKNETIDTIYKNGIPETHLWTYLDNLANGKYRAYIVNAGYDTTATYTVDYQILKTLHAQTFGNLSLSYPQSIISTLEGHSKALEQKQAKDSALDNLIDSSIYEKGYFNFWTRFSQNVNGAYHSLTIPMLPKKVVPIITLSNALVNIRDSAGNAILALKATTITLTPRRGGFTIGLVISDSTLAQYAKDYGCAVAFDWTADCRGRV